MRWRPRQLCLILALAVGQAPAAAAGEPLRVFAASSLTEAFRDIAAEFGKAEAGAPVELSFGGSQILRTQIEQGAPADVFAAADRVQTDALTEAGLLARAQVFARNALVVVVPASDARVHGLQDLARPKMKLIVAGPTVPVGRYTAQVLAKLAASGFYGDDFEARVQANVVSQETNVRAVVAKVALGEADAGFVYRTDVLSGADTVRALPIAERYNVTAEYPIAVAAKSRHPRAAAFVEWVLGPHGRAVLERYGFEGAR